MKKSNKQKQIEEIILESAQNLKRRTKELAEMMSKNIIVYNTDTRDLLTNANILMKETKFYTDKIIIEA